MNIIDASYFQRGKKFIPNISNLNTEIAGVPNSGNEIDYFIEKYERLFIISLFGVDFYNELKTALLDIDNSSDKYKNLIKGVEYQKNGKTVIFDGLRGVNKDSLLAYYIFCKYMENDESTYSTTGVIRSNQANAEAFNPNIKYLDAWFTFLTNYQNDCNSNQPSIIVNGSGVIGIDYYGIQDNFIVTLETYLKDHVQLYGNITFKRYEVKNSFGI